MSQCPPTVTPVTTPLNSSLPDSIFVGHSKKNPLRFGNGRTHRHPHTAHTTQVRRTGTPQCSVCSVCVFVCASRCICLCLVAPHLASLLAARCILSFLAASRLISIHSSLRPLFSLRPLCSSSLFSSSRILVPSLSSFCICLSSSSLFVETSSLSSSKLL